jgi:hypothetical protein
MSLPRFLTFRLWSGRQKPLDFSTKCARVPGRRFGVGVSGKAVSGAFRPIGFEFAAFQKFETKLA